MSTNTLLLSLFQYKAWANEELFAELRKLDPEQTVDEQAYASALASRWRLIDRPHSRLPTPPVYEHRAPHAPLPRTTKLAKVREA